MKDQTSLLNSFLEEWHNGDGIKARTSGSTGEPKTIMLSPSQVRRSAKRTCAFFGINRKSRVHSAVSFEFIGGKMMIARSLVSGCMLSYSEPSLNLLPPDTNSEVSLMAVVPAQLPHILDHLNEFSHIRKYLVGGSSINDKLWDRINASGIDAWESYGMTETASHIALRRIIGPSDNRPRFVRLPGINISSDKDGCLIIYDNEITVHTNDIIRIFIDGSFEILGRRDDVIITGGIKVLPQYVEEILRPRLMELCADFYISSLPDETWTSRLVLKVVPLPQEDISEPSLASAIRHAIDTIPLDTLPKKLRPKDILFIPALPLTPSGKLLRHKG